MNNQLFNPIGSHSRISSFGRYYYRIIEFHLFILEFHSSSCFIHFSFSNFTIFCRKFIGSDNEKNKNSRIAFKFCSADSTELHPKGPTGTRVRCSEPCSKQRPLTLVCRTSRTFDTSSSLLYISICCKLSIVTSIECTVLEQF